MKTVVLGALTALILAAPALGQPPPPAPPPPCAGYEYGALNFWVGRWDVYPTGKDTLVAHSLIERMFNGCIIRETWMPLKGTGGGSFSSYVPAEKGWRQIWVDSTGAWVDFRGAAKDGTVVLTGFWKGVNGPGQDALIRMTYSRNPDGSVRQLGEASTDDGKTWGPSFDFTYRPAKAL